MGIPEETDLYTKQQIYSALADGGLPYDGESVHAVGKPDAVYTRVKPEKLKELLGDKAAQEMGKTIWMKEMFGHKVVLGEPLLNQDGAEKELQFKDTKKACLDLNEDSKIKAVEEVFLKRESQLDAIRVKYKRDLSKAQKELSQIHREHPIKGCYLMSREEWKIPEGDLGYREKKYLPQILPKLKDRRFWSSSGDPNHPHLAFNFNGNDGDTYFANLSYGKSVRCACGQAAW